MLATLLAVLIALIGLLAIPVGLVYRVTWRGKLQGEFHLSWLFGLLHLHLTRQATSPASAGRQAHVKAGHPRKANTQRKTRPLAAWRVRPFRQRLLRFLRDLWRALHLRELRVRLLVGLGDPADTGQLWAIMGPVSAVLAQSKSVDFDVEPDFNESTLEFSSNGRLRIIPLQLIGLALALLLSPSIWYGLRQMHKAR